jgi:hypothetical protein
LFVYHVIKRKRTTLFGISIISLTAVFTYVLAKSSHSLNAYADHFGFTTLDFAWTHFKILVNFLSHFWTKGSAKLVPHSLFGVLTGLATVGYLARVVKKQVSCFELFVPFYLTPFTILPIMLEHRFLFPIIPLYLFYAFLGIQTISRLGSAYRRQVERLGFAGVVIVILVSYARQYTALDYGPIRRGINTTETQQIFEYVKNEVGEKEVVIFIRPRALSLFTGRASATWHANQDDEGLLDFFRQINASYLIVGPENLDPADQTYLRDFVDRNRSLFEERFANAHFRVYRMVKEMPKVK